MAVMNGNYREFELDNGLKVMLQNTPTETVNGRLRVFCGALHEKSGEEGLAHFLEHNLMMGGSARYSPDQIEDILESFGNYNASTSLGETLFPVDMLADSTEQYLEFVSDIAFNPRLDSTRFEEERRRVLRETSDEKSSPSFKDGRLYNQTFFGENSPYVYFIAGKEDVIREATPDHLREFHTRGYGASNMDLILAGALPDNIEAIIRKNFEHQPRGENIRYSFPRNPPLEKRSFFHTSAPELVNEEHPQESNAQLFISLHAPAESEQERYPVGMMADLLHSNIFKRVSQRLGHTYSIGSTYSRDNNTGIIFTRGSIHAVKADEVIETVFDEMGKLQTETVDQVKLDRMRRRTLYSIAKTYETNEGHAWSIQYINDHGVTPEDFRSRMNDVTPRDIQEMALKYLPQSRSEGVPYVMMLRDPLKD